MPPTPTLVPLPDGSYRVGAAVLKIIPAAPVVGRDLEFELQGLPPWQRVTIDCVDSNDQAPQCFTGTNTPRTVFADESGWAELGPSQIENTVGSRKIRISFNGTSSDVNYTVSDIKLAHQGGNTIGNPGVFLRLCGTPSASRFYYSSGVPAATVVDLDAYLASAKERLGRILDIETLPKPTIYLAENFDVYTDMVSGIYPGAEPPAGFFLRRGGFSGIYLSGPSRTTLAHEYVHWVLAVLNNGLPMPDWLNEGAAEFYSDLVQREEPSQLRSTEFLTADLVKEFLLSNSLPALSSIEIPGPDSDTAYNVSRMAVWYLVETFGEQTVGEVVRNLSTGIDIEDAILRTTAVEYSVFERGFGEWMSAWEDEEREAVRSFTEELGRLLDTESGLIERREENIASDLSFASKVPIKSEIYSESTVLAQEIGNLEPPAGTESLHQEAQVYFQRFEEWLRLESAYIDSDNFPLQQQANQMIPEIESRRNMLRSRLRDVEFAYSISA